MDSNQFPDQIGTSAITLIVRRIIHATPQQLFDAWTQPEHLKRWWGPDPVRCVAAEIDLRIGGLYRIANRFPDGNILWIQGEFEVIDPPHKLVYTWRVDLQSAAWECVTVQFQPCGQETEVIVTHERVPNTVTRDRHQAGWNGCLDGLSNYLIRRAGG